MSHLTDSPLEGSAKRLFRPAPRNSTDGDQHTEVAILIVMATIGMIGNFAILMVILVMSSLRRASNAFLFHHCILDFVKSAFCLPFAQSLMGDVHPLMCTFMGSTYIVFVTTSSFNLLALIMNEAYHFSDKVLSIRDSRNYSCVIFGIFMIWFSSIIMNLGVAFIPGNPSFDREASQCVFIYGITRNYVLHCLWIVLVTMGLVCTIVYIRMLYLDIKRSSYYSMATLIKATVSIDISIRTETQRDQLALRQKRYAKTVQRHTKKKLYLLISLVVCFILFWYPLFCVTLSDPTFRNSVPVYRVLTIIAWINPTITPFIVFFIIKVPTACLSESDKAILSERREHHEQTLPINPPQPHNEAQTLGKNINSYNVIV